MQCVHCFSSRRVSTASTGVERCSDGCGADPRRTRSCRRTGSAPSRPREIPAAAIPAGGPPRLAGGGSLRDAIEAEPIAWLGEAHVARFGTSTGVLAKLLDTAERLPVHVHPGRAFAREAFGSKFGKTEAWI